MRLSLRIKLIAAICVPLLVVFAVLLTVEYHAGKRRALRQMEAHLTELTAHQATRLDEQLATVAQVARCSADFMTRFPVSGRDDVFRLIRMNLVGKPGIFGSCMAFEPYAFSPDREWFAPYVCRQSAGSVAKGDLREMDIAADSYDYANWNWYELPKEANAPVWTEPYFDEGAGDVLMCTYSVPFRDEEEFRGVVTVDVSLDHLRDEMARVEIQGGHCMILSHNGTFVSHPDASLVMEQSIFSVAEKDKLPRLGEVGRLMTAGDTGAERIDGSGEKTSFWIVFAPVPTTGWSLAAVIPEEQVMAPVRERLNRQTALLLSGLAAIVIVVLIASTWITRPLNRLATAAGKVAAGDLDAQVTGITSRDEIGQFADTFNQMLADLKINVDARIEESSARKALERELQVARQIQVSMLPMVRPPYPDRSEFTLHADNEPAKHMAGDFFDFWFVDDRTLALVMADVSGKGVPAAMFMAVARTTIRNFSIPGRTPGETLEIANRVMASDNDEQMFVTVFYAHYDVHSGQLTFANAGHNPPAIIRSQGPVEMLRESTGPVLGAFDDAEFGDRQTHLDPDDMLLLYTDGVTEAWDPDERMFGEENLIQLADRLRDKPVAEVCQEIIERVNEFRHGEGQDDVTLLALRRAVDDTVV